MRAAIYTRVSTDDQAEHGYSLDEQEHKARQHIADRGWTLVEEGVFTDAGWSGAREDRPALQRMLARLDELDVIVVWSMDRLTRDLLLFAKLAAGLNAADVKVESLTAHVDLQTPEAEAMAGVAAVFGQFERKRIGERVSTVLEARARQGGHPGGPAPYGYRWHDKVLIIVPVEAEIVRRIYADYLSGMGQKGITRALNGDKVPTRHGGPWHQSAVSTILSTVTYAGWLKFKGEIYPGAHEASVDQDTWDRAAAIRADGHRRKGGRHPDGRHLLTNGVLKCPRCGSAMIPRKGRAGVERERYVCKGRIGDRDSCSQPSIRRELIDEPFLAHLLDGYVDIEATRQRIASRINAALERAREAEADAEAEVARIQRALETTERDYDRGDITGKQYSAREARLTDELAGARNALKQAHDHAEAIGQGRTTPDAEQVLLDYLAALKAAASARANGAPDLNALRNLIGQMFESVELVGPDDPRARDLQDGWRALTETAHRDRWLLADP